jgi:hypothetical protein
MFAARYMIGLATAAMLLTSITGFGPSAARAQALVPPNAASFPLTYGDWGARWTEWVMGIPATENPVNDTTGAQCGLGQWGPVFFLVGTTGSGPLTRSCTVPSGLALFFPLITSVCAIPEDGSTRAAIQSVCAGGIIDLVDKSSLRLTIDGRSVQNLADARASEFFSFTGAVPGLFETTGCGTPPCYEGFRATGFTDGYWAMVRPLPVGAHTIHFVASIPSFSFTVDATYNLTVSP